MACDAIRIKLFQLLKHTLYSLIGSLLTNVIRVYALIIDKGSFCKACLKRIRFCLQSFVFFTTPKKKRKKVNRLKSIIGPFQKRNGYSFVVVGRVAERMIKDYCLSGTHAFRYRLTHQVMTIEIYCISSKHNSRKKLTLGSNGNRGSLLWAPVFVEYLKVVMLFVIG